jgi:hypothetical protein
MRQGFAARAYVRAIEAAFRGFRDRVGASPYLASTSGIGQPLGRNADFRAARKKNSEK